MGNFYVKKVFRIVFIAVALYLTYNVAVSFLTRYKVVFLNYEKYLWLFSPEIQKDVDTIYSVGLERSNSIYYSYLCNDYTINIIEIPKLNSINLNDVEFVKNSNLSKVEFYPAKVLNSELSVFPTIRVWGRFPFNNKLVIHLDEESEILNKFSGEKYCAYFANIHRMSFANEKGKHIMLFDYKGNKQKTMLIIKKEKHGFYFIIVNSKDKITSDVLRVFNLD